METTESERTRVLLIEDDPDDVVLIREFLNGAQKAPDSFELATAPELEEGLRRLEEENFDVVLLDLSLPDGRGFETLARACEKSLQAPLIVLTASSDERLALEAISRGAQDYLVKSQVTPSVLAHSIRYAIERHRLQSQLVETAEKLQQANEKLEELVFIDPLTGLLNRRGLELVLTHEIATMRREGSELFALMLDLDDFKKINDVLGHSVGDVVLKEVAKKIRSTLRKTDQACRLGGDEFMVLLAQTRHAEAIHAAERLRISISGSPLLLSQGETRVTASVGFVRVSKNILSLDELIARTDVPLQQSKRRGKNQISFQGEWETPTGTDEALMSEVLEALQRGDRIHTVKQPIVHLEDRNVIGYEFLSRFSLRGFEMPDVFFPLCYEKNILNWVDLRCFQKCLADAKGIPSGLKRHFNLFPSTLLGVSERTLLDQFEESGGARNSCIEISEQQIIGDPWNLEELIHSLKKRGVLIAMDDVGFGKSCLESLVVLQPDLIKIDKRCVLGISEDPSRLRLLKRLLKAVRTVSFQIVAEGIETEEDLNALVDLGIKYGQGFFLGRPTAGLTVER